MVLAEEEGDGGWTRLGALLEYSQPLVEAGVEKDAERAVGIISEACQI